MVYGQHVCLNTKVVFSKKENTFKEVGLSYKGVTVCNQAWVDKVSANRLTPVCVTYCPSCLEKKLINLVNFKEHKKRIPPKRVKGKADEITTNKN